MRAIRFENPGIVRLVEAPAPEPPAGWARVRTGAAAICMTDLEALRGRIAAQYPLIPGHEWAGVVDSTGSAEDDNLLTALAINALSQWKFEPPTSHGRAVLVRASQVFNFENRG